MKLKLTALALAAVMVAAVAGSASAGATAYNIDPSHSTVGFSVKHMVVTNVHGTFDDFEGVIMFDEKNPEKSTVEVTIKTASVNTRNQKRDDHLRSGDFFLAEDHPTITFKSTKVKKKDDGWVAVGDLTIRGVTKTVELPFTVAGPVKNPWGMMVIGAEANLVIDRQEYGVSWNNTLDQGGLAVSNKVKISLNIEAAHKPEQS